MQIEKRRAYLGGDAEHSVLVKGLDFALLAARKAELAREGEEVADEELDALAEGLRGKNGTAPGKDAAGKQPEEKMAKGVSLILFEARDALTGAVPIDRTEEGGRGGGQEGREEEKEEEKGQDRRSHGGRCEVRSEHCQPRAWRTGRRTGGCGPSGAGEGISARRSKTRPVERSSACRRGHRRR